MKKQDLTRLLDSEELLEALAHVEHERWSGWEKYREKCVSSADKVEHEARWKKQRTTAYADLSDKEKESDRVEARKSLAVIRDHLQGGAFKEVSYTRGARTALAKYALDDTRSSPYAISYQQPTTSPEGRSAMIDQAFATNAALGQPDSELSSATNNILEPGLPPGAPLEPRHFHSLTDQMGDALYATD